MIPPDGVAPGADTPGTFPWMPCTVPVPVVLLVVDAVVVAGIFPPFCFTIAAAAPAGSYAVQFDSSPAIVFFDSATAALALSSGLSSCAEEYPRTSEPGYSICHKPVAPDGLYAVGSPPDSTIAVAAA